MAAQTVIVGSDDRSIRHLSSVLPEPGAAHAIELGGSPGGAPEDLPVRSVTRFPSVDVETASPGGLCSLLRPHLPEQGLLLLDSSQWSRDLAGFVVDSLDAPIVWAIDRVLASEEGMLAEHVVLGGAYRLRHRLGAERLNVVIAKPSGASTVPATTAPAVHVDASEPAPDPRVELISRAPVDRSGQPLADADVVICVGQGVGESGDLEVFERLADRLGAALGATRAVVDRGWAPFSRQIGQTGESVAPELYLGFGVSGAAQHLAGMRGAREIVAINTDRDAPLCRLADVVIEGDATDFATRLLASLEEGRAPTPSSPNKGAGIDV